MQTDVRLVRSGVPYVKCPAVLGLRMSQANMKKDEGVCLSPAAGVGVELCDSGAEYS